MAKSSIGGHWQPRVEDDALVRGQGRFMDDLRASAQAFGVFVRSPHAHARIVSIASDEARRAPGVLAVLTARDMGGVGNIGRAAPLADRKGRPMYVPPRPSLAEERVLHVGHPVALVIADTTARAQDAADLVAVEYEELPPVVGVREALEPGAPQLWPEAPNNVALDWLGPEPPDETNLREVEQLIATAPLVARITVVNQRIFGAAMEPRGATASYDPASGRFTLRACNQGVGMLRDPMAAAMGVDRQLLRVVADDVGGAFGLKTSPYPEYAPLLVAAKLLGRPVHWMSTRGEACQSDNQARDTHTEAELAMDGEGRFLALKVRHLASMGAFLSAVGAQIGSLSFARCLPTVYSIPRLAVDIKCVYTNTVPTGPYRGAGRPEANYMMERLVEEAARVTGIDRIELRRRNLIAPSAIPYRSAIGNTYDSGDFETILDQALVLADYANFAKRRAQSERAGRLRGIGVSCFLEHSGALPTESAAISFPGGETMTLALGVHSTGQGHATVFPRLAAERFGISPDQIQHRHGDSNYGLPGFASVGSRSAMAAGHATAHAADAVLAKGKKIAAQLLDAPEDKIEYRDGAFEVSGTNRRMPLFDLADKARELAAQGAIDASLDTKSTTDTPQTFPNGCHIAEVEIDPGTGKVAVVAYSAVDDCGNVLDHTIVEGQVQGGVAQGLGQALMEHAVYDPGNGQLLAASFMDYAMPRATDMPAVAGKEHVVPATTNPLGVKGVGEAGTTASIAAIMNAIADAIPGEAGAHLDMPATPEKVWRALRGADTSS